MSNKFVISIAGEVINENVAKVSECSVIGEYEVILSGLGGIIEIISEGYGVSKNEILSMLERNDYIRDIEKRS